MSPRPLLALLLLAACAPQSTQWTGTATARTPNPACPSTRATAQTDDDRVIFAPDDGTWILRGSINRDQTITAEKIGTAANKQAYETTLTATRTPTTIEGTYITPRCTYQVTLKKL